eukprot:CAMPEP_0178782082 /NCGR_PEP_ID=MMETSP0745-20121128/2957_1 /TAXON_ID=913974 /ORGANISM="Nitzschia punctata, Strain CCMP561" /LENGTH=104 /DNA_ID=CAMNT_0020439493 /DNA_START=1148 /DNA_END=1463 /DNA_ORIENTATION=+
MMDLQILRMKQIQESIVLNNDNSANCNDFLSSVGCWLEDEGDICLKLPCEEEGGMAAIAGLRVAIVDVLEAAPTFREASKAAVAEAVSMGAAAGVAVADCGGGS